MPNKRGISPLTTWHSQGGLLLISASWGLSYIVPVRDRVPFSEVFPSNLNVNTMPFWGAVLVIAAALAFISERVIAHRRIAHPISWRLGYGAHMVLAATYGALAVAAAFQGVGEVHGSIVSWAWWGQAISAISRTVLWGYIAYLHSTYARLPRPVGLPDERAVK